MYEMDMRQFDPAIARWVTQDPVTQHSYSPYEGFNSNPIVFADPSGAFGLTGGWNIPMTDAMMDQAKDKERAIAAASENGSWTAKVNDNGSVSYIAGDGSSASTFASQYGLDLSVAESITETSGSDLIDAGTEISGQSVLDATGDAVLKLDLNSEQGNLSQVRFNHFLFARDHSSSVEGFAFLSTDYFSGTKYKSMIEGSATMNINGENVSVHYAIPMYRPATFDGSSTATGLSNTPITSYPTTGVLYPKNQENIHLPLYHPDTGNYSGQAYNIFAERNNAKKIIRRLNKTFPTYNYIYNGSKIRN